MKAGLQRDGGLDGVEPQLRVPAGARQAANPSAVAAGPAWRSLRKLHAWCGVSLLLLIVPVALSGAALAFKPQWLRVSVPGAGAAPVKVDAAEAARAMAAAEGVFGRVNTLIFAGPEIGLHEVRLDTGGAYLRPADRGVVQSWGKNERVADWLFDLHHHLLMGSSGAKLAGGGGLLAAGLVLTGLALWPPAWRSFRGRLWPGRARRAGWLAAHRDLGVLAAPVLLLLILTGSALALGDLARAVLQVPRAQLPPAGVGKVDWAHALAAAQQRFPAADLRLASPAAAPGRPAVVRLRQPAEWHANGRTVVYIDPATSTVLAVDDPLTHPFQARLYNAFWPIHAAKVGGLPWRIATSLAGIALAALSLYGAESYRRKLMQGRRR